MKILSKYTSILSFMTVIWANAQQTDSLVISYNYVNSIPQNADIFLNDVYIGKTPMHFEWGKDVLNRKITIKLDGYAVFEYAVHDNVTTINKTFKLVSLSGVKEKEIVFKEKSYSFGKPIKLVPVIISTVVTAASAVMAYYYKSLAVEKKVEYLETGDPSAMDKKKEYDLIGGISLAVFQVGLCALIYYHFIDN